MARLPNRELRIRKQAFFRELNESSDPYKATVVSEFPPLRALEALRDLGMTWPEYDDAA